MESSKEFLANFHNLKGFTVGEKRKSLFCMANRMKSLDSNSLSSLLSSITPKDYLESVFRVELLIHFKRVEELFEILKNESEDLSTKIFKHPWFFQDQFDGFTAEFIVDDFLPHLSFVVRNRVIKSLAKYNRDERRNGQIFDKLLERYGIHSAKQIIKGCSIKEIEDILKKHDFKLTSPDLIPIFHKDPHLFELYAESHKDDFLENNVDWRIVREVVLNEPDMYFSMKYFFYNIRLGKKCTVKLINYCRETVISKASEIYDFLHLKAAYKSLDKQSRLLFLQNLFPKDLKKYTYNKIKYFLKHFPIAEQFRLFSSSFEKAYRKEIWDDEKYLSDELFELIQDEEERLKWIDIKIKSGTPPKTYYHYYEINKALSLIKEKLNITVSVDSRVLLVEKLVLACKFNNDVQALKHVLQYFCNDLKKVNMTIRSAFLSSLDMNFDLSELSEEHWKFINEVLHVQKVRKENYHRRRQILMKHVEYLWKNKQPIKERIAELLLSEDLKIFGPCDVFNKYSEIEELEREVIKIIDETLPQVTNNASTLQEERLKLAKYIVKQYNKQHKNKISLSDHPSLINSLKTYAKNAEKEEKEKYKLFWIFKDFLSSKKQYEFSKSIAEIYFEHGLEQYKIHSIILRYLMYDPIFLSKYIDGIVRSICTTCYEFEPRIWDYVKKLTHLELREKCIQFCLENYAEAKNPEDMLIILARLMYPKDYINFVSKHAPQVERMDSDNENNEKDCNIELAVVTSLKYTKSVSALPLVISFCIDDRLENSLNTLYYLSYHSPENKLYALLDKLSDRTSLKKHIFSLTSQIGCVHRVFILLKSAAEHETDAAIKKHLLNTTFKYFKKNPLDNFFNLLISCIPTLNILDSESLEPIVSRLDIPKQFQGRYYAFVLEFLSRLAEEHSEIWVEANKFLGQIEVETMKQLSYDFCTSFIDKYFLEEGHCFSEWSVREFVLDFLYDCDHDYEEKLNVILKKLVSHYRNNLNGIETRIQAIHRILFFLSTLVSLFTSDEDVAHAQIFFNRFFDCFAIEDFIGIYIQLKSLLIKKQFPNIIEYANEINLFLNELSAKYTSNVITHFANSLKKNLRPKEGHENIHELCFQLYKINKNVNACLLILSLLPNEIPDQHIRARFFSLLESLGSHSDVTVKIAFSTYIHSLEIEDNKKRGTILEAYGIKPMSNVY